MSTRPTETIIIEYVRQFFQAFPDANTDKVKLMLKNLTNALTPTSSKSFEEAVKHEILQTYGGTVPIGKIATLYPTTPEKDLLASIGLFSEFNITVDSEGITRVGFTPITTVEDMLRNYIQLNPKLPTYLDTFKLMHPQVTEEQLDATFAKKGGLVRAKDTNGRTFIFEEAPPCKSVSKVLEDSLYDYVFRSYPNWRRVSTFLIEHPHVIKEQVDFILATSKNLTYKTAMDEGILYKVKLTDNTPETPETKSLHNSLYDFVNNSQWNWRKVSTFLKEHPRVTKEQVELILATSKNLTYRTTMDGEILYKIKEQDGTDNF